jgi:predicted O-methyltransferase YrrM
VYISILYFGVISYNKAMNLENRNVGLSTQQASPLTTTSAHLLQRLARRDSFLSTLEELYAKYGSEIAAFRPVMRTWCQNMTQSCKFCDTEAEMLYMLIRETKPKNVFEMAPNRGYSTHWILQALVANDDPPNSHLYSYDIHDISTRYVKNPEFLKRWTFTLGDYRDLLKSGALDIQVFDFIFIDALHTEEFAREYCQKLLHQVHTNAVVAIHDIVADPYGGGRESSAVYKFLAFATDRIVPGSVFTMSRFAMPNLNAPIVPTPQKDGHAEPLDSAVPLVNKIRAKYGVIQPCQDNQCNNPVHDVVYFENGDSPTIFFALSSEQTFTTNA